MPESQYVVEARRRGHVSLTAARSGVETLRNQLAEIQASPRYSDQTKREQFATALAEGRTSIRGVVQDAREALEILIRGAEAHISAVRQVAPEALSERREALGPFLARAFEDRSVLLNLYRNNFEDPAARQVLEEHVELFTASGNPQATVLAEEWRALQEELAPRRSREELQALGDREALSEIAVYLDAGAELVDIDLAGLQEGGASAEQMLNRPFREARINEFEDKHGLPSSQPGAMRPEQLLEEEGS